MTNYRPIVQYPNPQGVVFPSMLQSMMAWRRHLGTSFVNFDPGQHLDSDGRCEYCGGNETLMINPVGQARCICAIKKREYRLREIQGMYQGLIKEVTRDDLEIWGDDTSRAELATIFKELERFVEWPDHWITLIGVYGTGKSDMLAWLANRFGPWALLITAEEFEQRVFDLKNQGLLPMFEQQLSYYPILLFDDVGSEYVAQGRDFVRSCLRSVLKTRYKMWQEFPVVSTTNRKREQLREYDNLIADRLLDTSVDKEGVQKTTVLLMNHVVSYRRHSNKE